MFTAKAATVGAARTGHLVVHGTEVATPNFIVATRRGAVPHLTPDHAQAVPAAGVYAEELWDRKGLVDVVCNRDTLPLGSQILIGACRRPGSRKITNKPNTNDSMGIDTTQGSHMAPLNRLMDFMVELVPDVFVIPYDVPAQTSGVKVGGNRLRKMHLRSLEWAKQFMARREAANVNCMLVAQIPPELYSEEYMQEVSKLCEGYCFTASESSGASPVPPSHIDAKRLRLSDKVPIHWGSVVDSIAAGMDLVLVPIESFSDRGLALSLTLAADTPEYMDLNESQYKTDMAQLGSTGHALAYIHHMLEAREMTAQVLLQQHNIAVITRLFFDIRQAIEQNRFSEAAERFKACYGKDR